MQADALPLPQPHQVSLREFFLLGEAGSAPPQPDIAVLKRRDDFYTAEHPLGDDAERLGVSAC